MQAPEAQAPHALEGDGASFMPLRLLLRFADAAYERRFVQHYVAFYLRYAQASLVLGAVLILGDYLVDRIFYSEVHANLLRVTVALPMLFAGLVYSMFPSARRHWQPVMAAFIVAVAFSLFYILARIDTEGGPGLNSWVGVLNFTFLEFYCFVILGVQFRYALASGGIILAAFEYTLWEHAGMAPLQVVYWSYHVLTVFILAAGIGWWREYLLRKEFVARSTLDDSRAAAEQRAVQLAHYDEVTGLPNRRLFAGLAAPVLERAARQAEGCALLHIEIERLGGVQNVYGRTQVDAVLNVITQRIRQLTRGGDLPAAGPAGDDAYVLARLGDNAFSMLIAKLDAQEHASVVAQRLLTAVAQPIVIDAQALVLSASVGIAMFPGDAGDFAGLTRCAEQAARAAGDAGGGQHRFFDEALNTQARDRVLLEAELPHAMLAGQLQLHYQPKVDVRDGQIVGVEALARWLHPQRGMLLPESFIPLAEESSLIESLTDWVLQTACRSLRRWADEGLRAVPLSVNLPASSLADARLLGRLDELMLQYGLRPDSLILELTESMLMHDTAAAIQVLERLRRRGFGLALDDFGTGYSALGYLQRLPVSELKIDRSFITDVAKGGRHGALATAVITLGRELGLQVVAEGVETWEQSDFLLVRGCVLQQGYLYAGAVPQAEFEEMLRVGVIAKG